MEYAFFYGIYYNIGSIYKVGSNKLEEFQRTAAKWILSSCSYKTRVTSLLQQLQLESLLEKIRKVQRLAFMYKFLNDQVAVPVASLDLILSSRPRGTDANQQKLITVRSYTENYRQFYSIRTVKDWNSLPQSVVSAGSLALFKSRLTIHVAP